MEPSKILLFFFCASFLYGYSTAASTCKLSDIKAVSSTNSAGLSDASDSENIWRIKIQVTNTCKYCDAKDVKVQVLKYDSSSICNVTVGKPVLVNRGKSISPGEVVVQDYYQSSAVVSIYNCLSVNSTQFVNCRN